MGNLEKHAKMELLAAGYKPIEEEDDNINKWMQESILELIVDVVEAKE